MFVQLKSNTDYLITDDGKVISIKFGKWRELKLNVSPVGYVRAALSSNNKTRLMLVHRLVMEAFCGPSKLEVNHKNGNKADNRLENLEYCTTLENQRHAWKTGLKHMPTGENNPGAKLSNEDVQQLLSLRGTMTCAEAGKRFGISKAHVSDIWTGKYRSQK